MAGISLLTQNLLYNISQTGIPSDNVDSELVSKPLKWNPKDIGRFMIFFGPISSVFDIATFALTRWVFGANTVAHQSLFQSAWFESHAAAPLTVMTLAIMTLGNFPANGSARGLLQARAVAPLVLRMLLAILTAYSC